MEEKIKLLKALADETRLKIVLHLLKGEKCACTIVPSIGKAQSTVSGHLKILEDAGILSSRRVGTNIWYRVKSEDTKEILRIIGIQK
ncbi:winged helix-turn-helix transcriptional regulator [Candidatus Woesearchaeota archaeon]|nr:winged helix-turn-helix transcriptional regulator [Candidatus Woesearchaeota archaeon]